MLRLFLIGDVVNYLPVASLVSFQNVVKYQLILTAADSVWLFLSGLAPVPVYECPLRGIAGRLPSVVFIPSATTDSSIRIDAPGGWQ